MAGRSSREVEEILTALSPLVSTKQRRPVVVRRTATPTRKVPLAAMRPKEEDHCQSVSPLKPTVPRKPGSDRVPEPEMHPFMNMKIRMLINLHNSMQEDDPLPEKDAVKLPRLTDLRRSSLSSGKKS